LQQILHLAAVAVLLQSAVLLGLQELKQQKENDS
jgi:hypothetical protein